MPSPSTSCILTAQVTHVFLGEKTRRHPPVFSWAEQESCHQSKPSKSHHTGQNQPQTPDGIFCPRCLALTHLELDRKSPSQSWPLALTSHEDGNFSTPMDRVLKWNWRGTKTRNTLPGWSIEFTCLKSKQKEKNKKLLCRGQIYHQPAAVYW